MFQRHYQGPDLRFKHNVRNIEFDFILSKKGHRLEISLNINVKAYVDR